NVEGSALFTRLLPFHHRSARRAEFRHMLVQAGHDTLFARYLCRAQAKNVGCAGVLLLRGTTVREANPDFRKHETRHKRSGRCPMCQSIHSDFHDRSLVEKMKRQESRTMAYADVQW